MTQRSDDRRRATITGGARPNGIGWASACALAEDGYEVVVTGATEEEVERAPHHPSIDARLLDVTDDDAVTAFFAEFDRLDALVTCAGLADPGREFTPEGFVRTIDVNLNGTMRCCLAARPLLAPRKGAIVTIGSMYSIFGSPHVPGYTASKGGCVQLTKSLATAWGPDIRINAVLPGWIKTSMGQSVRDDPVLSAAILERTPAGRFGEPDELAHVIRFLCSPSASFLTGTAIPVDGGYSCSG